MAKKINNEMFEDKSEFLKSDKSLVYHKANKIVTIATIGMGVALISLAFDYVYKSNLFSYILDGLLFIFSLVFFTMMNKTKKNQLNKYLSHKKNTK